METDAEQLITETRRSVDLMMRLYSRGVFNENSAAWESISSIAENMVPDELHYFLAVAPNNVCHAAANHFKRLKEEYSFCFSGPYFSYISKEDKLRRDRELQPVFAKMYDLYQAWLERQSENTDANMPRD